MTRRFSPRQVGAPRLLPASLFLMPIVGAQVSALAQGPTQAVLISHRVTNTSTAPAEDVTAVCILPATNRYQEVVDTRIDPAPASTRADAEKQEIITVPLGDIPPGQTRSVRVLVWARPKALRVNLLGPGSKTPTSLPADIEAGQLEDGYLLQLEKIRPLAEKHAGEPSRDLDRARKAFDYMTRECTYDIDDRFETADKILAGSPASCTELAYTYVALCRALGIPARLISAYVNREGTSPSTDWRTHRWVELYTREYGWIPADPTNRINDSSKNFFGQQEAKYLTVIDDGVTGDDEPDPAWRVFLAHSRTVPIELLRFSRSAVWRVSSHRLREADSFKKACELLRSGDIEARRQAVAQWTGQRETMTHGYLLEALFDSDLQVRRQAAAALGKTRDESMIIPLALLAARENDPELKDAMLFAAHELLTTPKTDERAQAVVELARSRTPEALGLLDGIWNDEAREVRKAAAQSLYKFGDDPQVHDAYRLLVNDADEFIRALATLRWARTGSREPELLLVDMLESDVRWDREQALKELVKRSGDTFELDPAERPDRKSNQEALARWRAWLDVRDATAAPAESPSPQAATP